MKLYATVTATKLVNGETITVQKGQGSNEFLNITLNVGEKPTYFIGLYENGTFIVEHIESEVELYRFSGIDKWEEKGNKQKGDTQKLNKDIFDFS